MLICSLLSSAPAQESFIQKVEERFLDSQQMNEKMSKRRIQIRDLQKQEIQEKQERKLLITLHISSQLLLINL
jgi:hypothetical protein